MRSVIEKADLRGQNLDAWNKRTAAIVVAAFSVFYFCYVVLIASGRYFWIDEISTVITADAPNLRMIWNSPKHIADFQTFAFYLLIRATRALLGHGLIATRIPAIVGFYVFCVSLFAFVWRRVGVLGGTVAMLFPIVTSAFLYSYEARPYAIQMGFAGLALVCWQFSTDGRGRRWTWGFALSLFGALMMHPFAVCFAAAFLVPEMLFTLSNRRIRLDVLAAVCLPVLIAAATYLPVAAAFRSSAAEIESFFTVIVPGNVEGSIEVVYQGLFGTCLTVLFVCLGLMCIRFVLDKLALEEQRGTTPIKDVLLAVALLLTPILGALVALLQRAHFYTRYVHWTVAGFAIILGFGAGVLRRHNYVGPVMAVILALVIARSFLTPLHKRLEGEVQTTYGPEDTMVSYVKAGDAMALHELLDTRLPDLPIVTPSLKDFIYIEYNSQQLRSRLEYTYPNTPDYGAYSINGFREYYHTPLTEPLKISLLLQHHSHFLYYGTTDGRMPDFLRLLRRGAIVNAFKLSTDGTHFLADLQSINTK